MGKWKAIAKANVADHIRKDRASEIEVWLLGEKR